MTDANVCRCCGQPLPESGKRPIEAARLDDEARLEKWCRDQGHRLTPDLRVGGKTAAEIVGTTCGTLRNMRYAGTGPDFHRRGSRGAVTYSLQSLVAYLNAQKKKPNDL